MKEPGDFNLNAKTQKPVFTDDRRERRDPASIATVQW
jgi:hypothetical protein